MTHLESFDNIKNKNHLTVCPVCLSSKLRKNYFTSKSGYLSLAGYAHSLCLRCRSVFVDPLPSEDELDLFYQSLAHDSENEKDIRESTNRILDGDRYQYFFEHRIKPLVQFIDRDMLIFDIGCGSGCFVKAMKDLKYRISGADISKISIQIGREIFGLGEDELLNGDIRNINIENLGVITLWTLIEHIPHPAEYLQMLHTKLAKNGILLLEFPTVDSLMFQKFKQDFFWVMPPYHLLLYSIQGMKILLERAGFELLLEHRMPHNWGFFEALAKKSLMPKDMERLIKIQAPSFTKEVDLLMDDIAYSLGLSSSVQMIARKI